MPKLPLPRNGWRLIRRFDMRWFSFYNPVQPPRCRRCGRRLTRGHVLTNPSCPRCPVEIYVGGVCSKRLRGLLPNPPKGNGNLREINPIPTPLNTPMANQSKHGD